MVSVRHVLDNRRYPYRVKPHALDVVKVIGYSLEGATAVGGIHEFSLRTRITPDGVLGENLSVIRLYIDREAHSDGPLQLPLTPVMRNSTEHIDTNLL